MVDQLLRQRIILYLNRSIGLQELEEWVVANLQSILNYGSDKAKQLANEIDADVVFIGEGLFTENELRNKLLNAVVDSSDGQMLTQNIISSVKFNSLTDPIPVIKFNFPAGPMPAVLNLS